MFGFKGKTRAEVQQVQVTFVMSEGSVSNDPGGNFHEENERGV